MSDTPRTDADDRNYPSPEYAQRIRFEGCDCVVMHPEEYESLYEKARQLERELNAANERIKRLEHAGPNAIHEASNDRVYDAWEIWNKASE